MSIVNNYNNPVVHNWNYDENGKPTSVLRENEVKPIVDGKIVLEEIPDPYRRVFIDGYVEIDLKKEILDEFHYKVDYSYGIVYFHPNKEGESISISRYYGKGMFYTPASRIWTKIDDFGNVVKTIADVEDQIALIGNMADNANDILVNLDTNVTLGSALNKDLKDNAIIANTSKTNLDQSIQNSVVAKTNLDGSISTGNELKIDLEDIFSNANLDELIQDVQDLQTNKADTNYVDTELGKKVTEATLSNKVRATALTGLSTVTNAVISATDTVLGALGKLQKQISDNLSTLTGHIGNKANPHGTTKTHLSLGNVENKSSATIRGEITSTNVTTALGYTPLNSNLKGANNGLAELDGSGKVLTSQLPSYVNDVIEYSSINLFPVAGESGKIYIDTTSNTTYRWSGSTYTAIGSDLALGETSSSAGRGDWTKTAYDHSQTSHAPSNAQKNSDITKLEIETKLTGTITSHQHDYMDTVTTINGKTGAITKADIVALGIPAQDTITEIVDNLTTDDGSKALSARQGKELFQSVSSGKNLIATSVTDKGVPTSGSDSFSTMATNIGLIETDKTGDATAIASDLLSGKTAYAKGNKLTGTIPSKGAETFTPGINAQTITAGQYLSGTQTISAVAGLTAANIKNATVVGGVSGTYKGTGTATAAQVLSGATFSTASLASATGTIPSKGAATITPGTATQTIAAGQYLSGIQTISPVANLSAANIKSGVVVGGVTGTAPVPSGTATAARVLSGYSFSNASSVGLSGSMVNRGAVTSTLTTQGGAYTIPVGYHSGTGKVTANITNLSASNIKQGINVGGVVGTYAPPTTLKKAYATIDYSSGSITTGPDIHTIARLSLPTGVTASNLVGVSVFARCYMRDADGEIGEATASLFSLGGGWLSPTGTMILHTATPHSSDYVASVDLMYTVSGSTITLRVEVDYNTRYVDRHRIYVYEEFSDNICFYYV